jgi:hypothetical protein
MIARQDITAGLTVRSLDCVKWDTLLERSVGRFYTGVASTGDFGVRLQNSKRCHSGARYLACSRSVRGCGASCAGNGRGRSIFIHPEVRPLSSPHTKSSNEVIPTRCVWVVMARLKSPLEVVNSIAEPGSKATYRAGVCSAWTQIQYRWGVLVRKAGGRQLRKHTKWGSPPRRPWGA